MKRFFFIVLGIVPFCFHLRAQVLSPVAVSGFNQDVVAEGTGSSSLATTTREMDAIPISNFVMCSRGFAEANGFSPSGIYGLPDDGLLSSASKSFRLAAYDEPNVLYLFAGDSGMLSLIEPTQFSDLSILALATEGNSQVRVTLHFTDGSRQTQTSPVPDWFNPAVPAGFNGYGRVKRIAGPISALDYQGAPNGNPRFSTLDYPLSCTKSLTKIGFRNVGATIGQSFRIFILAVAGTIKTVRPAIRITASDSAVCQGRPIRFTATADSSGTNPVFSWRINGQAVGSGQPVFTSSTLSDGDTVTCMLTSSAACANPATVLSNPIRVTIRPLRTPEVRVIATDTSLCSGIPVNFTALASGAGIRPEYRWRLNGTPSGEDSSLYVLTNPQNGDRVHCLVLSTEECRTQNSAVSNVLTMEVIPVLSPDFEIPDTLLLDAEPITLSGTPEGGVFSGPGLSGNRFIPASAGMGDHDLTYSFPENRCTSPVVRQVHVREEILPCNKEPYTLLTPNGDGENDRWVVGDFNRKCLRSASVEIFNRWGERVYEAENYQNEWDGNREGKNLLPGCYFFSVRYTDIAGNKFNRTGVVALLR